MRELYRKIITVAVGWLLIFVCLNWFIEKVNEGLQGILVESSTELLVLSLAVLQILFILSRKKAKTLIEMAEGQKLSVSVQRTIAFSCCFTALTILLCLLWIQTSFEIAAKLALSSYIFSICLLLSTLWQIRNLI